MFYRPNCKSPIPFLFLCPYMHGTAKRPYHFKLFSTMSSNFQPYLAGIAFSTHFQPLLAISSYFYIYSSRSSNFKPFFLTTSVTHFLAIIAMSSHIYPFPATSTHSQLFLEIYSHSSHSSNFQPFQSFYAMFSGSSQFYIKVSQIFQENCLFSSKN